MDSRSLSRTAAATGLVVGPLLYVVGNVIDPAWADGQAAYLAEVRADTAAYTATGIVQTVAALVFIVGTLGLARLLRGRTVTLGQVGALLMTAGLVGLAANAAFNAFEITMAEAGDRAAAVALARDLEDSALLNGYWMGFFFLGIVLGSILVTVALVRRPVVPRWAPALLLLGVLAGFAGEGRWVSAATFALVAAGLVPLAHRIWRMSDDDWSRWAPLGETEPAADPAFAPAPVVAR